jgi:hypothetical protein
MTRHQRYIDARRSRRVRTRVTRALALAVAGPLMAGSIAYAAGVGPVRRRVDDFLKGTARLLDQAESSTGEYHLSPNPVGRGVLVMPMDDRGPRPASETDREQDFLKSKTKKTSSSDDEKVKSEASRSNSKESKSHEGGGKSEASGTSSGDSKGAVSATGSGSGEGSDEAPENDSSGSDDDSGEGSDGSGTDNSGEGSADSDDSSGSDSGSSGSDDGGGDSGSGESGSGSDD